MWNRSDIAKMEKEVDKEFFYSVCYEDNKSKKCCIWSEDAEKVLKSLLYGILYKPDIRIHA